jgi:hypothetical protein
LRTCRFSNSQKRFKSFKTENLPQKGRGRGSTTVKIFKFIKAVMLIE